MKKNIRPSSNYDYVDDICIVTSYFNPNKYITKKNNFEKFINPVRKSGLKYLVVECSFNDDSYEIDDPGNVIRVNSNAVLWQKERLLNVALNHIPIGCSKIVWIDSDILFSNPGWAKQTSCLLEKYPVVQPFEFAIRLSRSRRSYQESDLTYNGFAYIYDRYPNLVIEGDYTMHGHTGFVWAARKEVFDNVGFYDSCLSGGGDHLMAHAFAGDWHSICLKRMFLDNTNFYLHYQSWAQEIYKEVRGRIGYTDGIAMHLWHGEYKHRKYLENMQFLSSSNFNPARDLYINETGCWEIRPESEELKKWSKEYFGKRKEDGDK